MLRGAAAFWGVSEGADKCESDVNDWNFPQDGALSPRPPALSLLWNHEVLKAQAPESSALRRAPFLFNKQSQHKTKMSPTCWKEGELLIPRVNRTWRGPSSPGGTATHGPCLLPSWWPRMDADTEPLPGSVCPSRTSTPPRSSCPSPETSDPHGHPSRQHASIQCLQFSPEDMGAVGTKGMPPLPDALGQGADVNFPPFCTSYGKRATLE